MSVKNRRQLTLFLIAWFQQSSSSFFKIFLVCETKHFGATRERLEGKEQVPMNQLNQKEKPEPLLKAASMVEVYRSTVSFH